MLRCIVHRTLFSTEQLMEWEVNSPELTLESVRLANYHYGDVYELWRDCEIRCSHAHLGR